MRLWNNDEGRARYLAESQRILDEVWEEAWLLDEIDRVEELIAPHLLDSSETMAWMDGVRDFVEQRRVPMEEAIANPPESEYFEHDKFCVEPLGTLKAEFETEWDSLDVENVFVSYPSSMDGELESFWGWNPEIHNALVGAQAGFGNDGPTVSIIGIDEDYRNLTVATLFSPGDLRPGTYPVDVVAVPGFVYAVDLQRPNAEPEYFYFMGGEVTFDEVSSAPGDPISGSLDVVLLPPFW